MGIVLVHSSDSKSVRPSRLHVNGGRRTVCRVLPNAAHQSIPSRRTSVVSPKLSRSDLVQGALSEVEQEAETRSGTAPRHVRGKRVSPRSYGWTML